LEIPRGVSGRFSSSRPKSREKNPTAGLYPWPDVDPQGMRFAERVLHGIGEDGSREEIVIWIERRAGALWAVGRAIDLQNRSTPVPRADDYVFEGYEMGDALLAANNALRDDLSVSAEEGLNEPVEEFAEDDLLKPLERWFFGHKP
jgi:hypothetical protein